MSPEQLYDAAVAAGKRLLGAVIILIVGLQLVKYFLRYLEKYFEKHHVDETARCFILPLVRVSSYILLGLIIVSTLGVEMTSIIALLTSAGVAIGLALQGSLANIAGGVLILVLKMFKVGDYIEGAGQAGIVESIQLFYTVLRTPDNRKVIVPNAQLANSSIVDYSANPIRRLDVHVSTSYEDDVDVVMGILRRIVEEEPRILPEPAPMIVVGEFTPISVNYFVRVWVKTPDVWPTRWAIQEKVRREFAKAGIRVPTQEVRLQVNPNGSKVH